LPHSTGGQCSPPPCPAADAEASISGNNRTIHTDEGNEVEAWWEEHGLGFYDCSSNEPTRQTGGKG
jgi:hypothetical protein